MKYINKIVILIIVFSAFTCNIALAENEQKTVIKTVNHKNIVNVGVYKVTGELQPLHFRIVINDNMQNINNSIYIENIPKGLSVDNASLVVEKYLGENKYQDVTKDVNTSFDDNEIKIELGNIKDKYVIKYDAKIIDLEKKSFDSLGSFFYQNSHSIKSMDEVVVTINVNC